MQANTDSPVGTSPSTTKIHNCSGCRNQLLEVPRNTATAYCDECAEVAGHDKATREAHYAAVRDRRSK